MKRSHYLLLRDAIEMAAAWKGGKMPEEWPEFDAQIARMRYALDEAKKNIAPPRTARIVLNVTKDAAYKYASNSAARTGTTNPFGLAYDGFIQGYTHAVREYRARLINN